MEHIFNPSPWRQRQMDPYESEAILAYIVKQHIPSALVE